MKLRIDVNGSEYVLNLEASGTLSKYEITGALKRQGAASVEVVMPGVFSILDDGQSYLVRLVPVDGGVEAWVAGRRYMVYASDPRDRASGPDKPSTKGPLEIHATMPGKVIRLLVKAGDSVTQGNGLIVVEAMKMQNEIKSPKSGVVTRVQVTEGATVKAGQALLVVE